MALRLTLMDGDRVLATYSKRDVVGRMLDAAGAEPEGTPTRKAARKGKPRRALGKGAEPTPDEQEA